MKIALLAHSEFHHHISPSLRYAEYLAGLLEHRGAKVDIFGFGCGRPGCCLAAVSELSAFFEKVDDYELVHSLGTLMPLAFVRQCSIPLAVSVYSSNCETSSALLMKHNGEASLFPAFAGAIEADVKTRAVINPGMKIEKIDSPTGKQDYALCLAGAGADIAVLKSVAASCINNRLSLKVVAAANIEDLLRSEGLDVVIPDPAHDYLAWLHDAAVFIPAGIPPADFVLGAIESIAYGTPVAAPDSSVARTTAGCLLSGYRTGAVESFDAVIAAALNFAPRECRDYAEREFVSFDPAPALIDNYSAIISCNKKEDHRPWGYYKVLADEHDHKVKRIVVYPGQRLSLQRHFRRKEHWYVAMGIAAVTLGEKEIHLTAGEAVDIPQHEWHRMRNPGSENLTFIEVQMGDYFGEDDIERAQDDYGRS